MVSLASSARAAEDLRGQRGWFIGGGMNGVLGGAVDDTGRGTPSYFGSGGQLRIGEEVIDRLTLGLELGGGGGAADDFDVGLGGFLLQASWRPGWGTEGLLLLAGTGGGGAGITAKEGVAGAPAGSQAGALFQLGVAYEWDLFGRDDEGFAIAPALRWTFVPATPDNEVQLSAFGLGLDFVYYAGR